MSDLPFSPKVLGLIRKTRIVSFDPWQAVFPVDVLQRFQAANDESRYLTPEDLHQVATQMPELAIATAAVEVLQSQIDIIIGDARTAVLQAFPGITQPGGGLYPPERTQACWRDCWQFLRCITYGIAAQRTDYTSAEGLSNLRLLYQELQVPLDAMLVALEGMKAATLKRAIKQPTLIEPCFDHLIGQLRQF